MTRVIRQIFTFRWKPSWDLLVVGISWLLVVGSLYTATFIVTAKPWGGMAYFALYAVVMGALFGIGIPLFWMVIVRKRPLSELGLTFKRWRLSIALQVILAVILYVTGPKLVLSSLTDFIPLVGLSLAIGFFEAVFWRGWILTLLEKTFGIIPAILLGSVLYAAYHVGYGMSLDDMVFLFFIGIMFAVVFRFTGSVLILWPVFQPMGQLITLTKDGLSLPLLATLGFVEALALMLVMVWLASRYYRKYQASRAVSESNNRLNQLASIQ